MFSNLKSNHPIIQPFNLSIYTFNEDCSQERILTLKIMFICILGWNPDEKTFDCPCHGSRFSNLGKVVNGPAHSDLEEIDLDTGD